MTTRATPPLAAALLAATLAACASGGTAARPAPTPSAPAAPAPAAPAPAAPAPAAPVPGAPAAEGTEGPLPGVALDGLTAAQRAAVLEVTSTEFCPCGCPHTIAACLAGHRTCSHSARAARLAVRLARLGGDAATAPDLRRWLTAYYASFDKRPGPDPAPWGPPLGDAGAKVTLLEISDFTCPFCRKLRPELEAFVNARAGRVKLVYLPFPIESHPGALEAAQAGEWAREAGLFWPMHDALMEAVHPLSTDELAELARALGGDPESLRAALEEGRHLRRLEAARSAARAAGLRGTPTLYLNGRQLVVPDFSEAALEDALADEEEWAVHGGWARD